MKISLNVKFLKGPYGGGMQFAHSLKAFLLKQGAEVINTLNEDNIDVILHIAPFSFQEISSYSYIDAYIYKVNHPKTKIVLRVNECDERKNTTYINKALIDAANYCDRVIFIASWLRDLFYSQGMPRKIPTQVILNGADTNIFNMQGKRPWNHTEKLRIVTHHWGGNMMKGHDVYKYLDQLLQEDNSLKDKFEFTFIGNLPKKVHYSASNLLSPLSGKSLGDELKRHHIYLTATRNEPAGMHHVEGALCGLPLLYLNSGALPEYCSGFGIMFERDTFKNALFQIHQDYDMYFSRMKDYGNTSDKMCQSFFNMFNELITSNNPGSNPIPHNFFTPFFLRLKESYHFLTIRFLIAKDLLLKQ